MGRDNCPQIINHYDLMVVFSARFTMHDVSCYIFYKYYTTCMM